MKINETAIRHQPGSPQSKKADPLKQGLDFKQVLDNQVKGTAPGPATDPLQARSVIVSPPLSTGTHARGPVQTVRQALDTVEHYKAQLSDPGTSLRAMGPTVDKMRTEATALNRLLQDLPAANPQRQVVEATHGMVTQEIERFDAGYYIDR